MSHDLAPFVVQVHNVLDRQSEPEIRDALAVLYLGDDANLIVRAAYEMERARRRGIRLSATRALTIARAHAAPDPLALPASSGLVAIFRRADDEEALPSPAVFLASYVARMPILRATGPTRGPYKTGWQPGWNFRRWQQECRRAARRLP